MRRVLLSGTALVLALSLAGVASGFAAPQAAQPRASDSKTLTFDVVFSPFSLVAANNVRDPSSPFALGDEIVFHDQLYSKGQAVGDSLGSCVIVAVSPDVLANCTALFRLPEGSIAAQFANAPGPAPKSMALTGGTGVYRNAGGEGTLVEFGNGKGTLTLDVLGLAPRGGGA